MSQHRHKSYEEMNIFLIMRFKILIFNIVNICNYLVPLLNTHNTN